MWRVWQVVSVPVKQAKIRGSVCHGFWALHGSYLLHRQSYEMASMWGLWLLSLEKSLPREWGRMEEIMTLMSTHEWHGKSEWGMTISSLIMKIRGHQMK